MSATLTITHNGSVLHTESYAGVHRGPADRAHEALHAWAQQHGYRTVRTNGTDPAPRCNIHYEYALVQADAYRAHDTGVVAVIAP